MKTDNVPPTLSTSELQKFINYIESNHNSFLSRNRSIRNVLMVLLMCDAGLRVGEVIRLSLNDLLKTDEAVENLIVRAEITKTKQERIVPLSERIQAAIIKAGDSIWIEDPWTIDDFAFKSGNGAFRITARTIQRICKEAGHFSIGREVNPHLLRHTFATRTLRVSNIRVVQQLLGHVSLSSTQIYTHPNGDDLQNAISNLDA